MFTKFHTIDREKQVRILNAAMKEFGAKGYQAASTNEIAKEADISKGILFHYFTSKKDLYLYLFDYAVREVSEGIHSKVDKEERDLFVKLRKMAEAKLEIFNRYPDIFEFLKSACSDDDKVVMGEIDALMKETAANEFKNLLHNVDLTSFKKRVDPMKAINVILWSLEGLSAQKREMMRLSKEEIDIPALMQEFDEYIALFKASFLKK
ncbi:TetR/AcrR family transcriptional regulator [Paenibacillus sp. HB172176]|uniref:TetR/AcrR family transcriptional regulator n=1 Tax=Paenibacillus sp. HB172176 TaxID=2493690 RepID=UPI00143A67F3|nr:TetR/AcrR family transcriptional regulator [Paenibacillus sp. HB172176]